MNEVTREADSLPFQGDTVAKELKKKETMMCLFKYLKVI